jgi:type IV pilus assembly protein PilB
MKNDILTSIELKTLLLDVGVVTEDQLTQAEERAKDANETLAEALIWYSFISDEEIGRLMADHLQFPFVIVSEKKIPAEILNIVPEVVASSHSLMAFALDASGLHVAMTDPNDLEMRNFLEKKSGLSLVVYFATKRDIKNSLSFYRKEVSQAFNDIIGESIQEAEQNKSGESDPPIIRIVDTLISYAYQNRASDIHLEPREKDMLVRFRVDGVLHDIVKLPPKLHPQIISRIKILAKLRTDEHQTPQDGKMEMLVEDNHLDVRVSIIPTTEGEKVVSRLLSERSRQFSLSNLGLLPDDLEKLKEAYQKPYGMILVTGPTGCGKTTTLYAVLKLLNRRAVNIVTIEDPVEYDMEGVNQIQVNSDANLTFATGLRSILRQDPNIILVGEIRDDETASIAINLAMTGHLVLSTLHTNNASTAIPRLIDMQIEPFLIASTINVVMAQRLVRKIHNVCRVSEEVDAKEILKNIGKPSFEKVFGAFEEGKKIRFYKGKGCDVCHNTGYEGREGIFELLILNDEIREAIVNRKDADAIEKLAINSGMRTMLEGGLLKVKQGITTLDEILRATKE